VVLIRSVSVVLLVVLLVVVVVLVLTVSFLFLVGFGLIGFGVDFAVVALVVSGSWRCGSGAGRR
jgi:hypothetical protein